LLRELLESADWIAMLGFVVGIALLLFMILQMDLLT
jgi:hypothetical protein